MKALSFDSHGNPLEVLRLRRLPMPEPEPGQALVRVIACPVNPMDLLVIRGHYPLRASFPAIPGVEGVGSVECLGRATEGPPPGTLVLLPVRCGSWRTHLTLPATELVPLPDAIDPEQASMLRVNALSATALLEESGLERGQWLIHSPGAGSVAQFAAQLAKADGIRLVHVTRSLEAAERLAHLGVDRWVEAGPRLRQRVREATGDAAIELALDGTGGAMTHDLASCLIEGGEVVTYGAMSRQPSRLGVDQTVFRGIELRGFWLHRWTREVGPDETVRRLRALSRLSLRSQVAGVYGLEDFRRAIRHARRPRCPGRVLLAPSG